MVSLGEGFGVAFRWVEGDGFSVENDKKSEWGGEDGGGGVGTGKGTGKSMRTDSSKLPFIKLPFIKLPFISNSSRGSQAPPQNPAEKGRTLGETPAEPSERPRGAL